MGLTLLPLRSCHDGKWFGGKSALLTMFTGNGLRAEWVDAFLRAPCATVSKCLGPNSFDQGWRHTSGDKERFQTAAGRYHVLEVNVDCRDRVNQETRFFLPRPRSIWKI